MAFWLLLVWFVPGLPSAGFAHPLGNFTINHYARLTIGPARVVIRYVIDMAEISTLQELQKLPGGSDGAPAAAELERYLQDTAAEYAGRLVLMVDDRAVPLDVLTKTISLAPGAGGLPTLRIELDLAGAAPAPAGGGGAARQLYFADTNRRERIGWREIVVAATDGIAIFDSTAYGNGLTDELKSYPQELLAAPLREETARLSFTKGAAPAGAAPLQGRDGKPAVQARDRLAELISVPELTPQIALLGLLLATAFGALHAFSPGHGKTVVGAYLIGARGTAKHAAILGLTVTVTHTLGVLALGLVTLFAAQYILPEQLFPVLSFISGAIVVAIGFSLFAARVRATRGHRNGHEHHDEHAHDAAPFVHSHGGREHVHLPPGAGGAPVTWRTLLALGISGGLLPCPSALVVLLSAIAFHRTGYGLLLVLAFSLGLAGTLTGVGLAFVHAGRWMKRPAGPAALRAVRVLPVVSAFVIGTVGLGICYEALIQAGFDLPQMLSGVLFDEEPSLGSANVLAVLGLGLVFGLKHATEADHVIAVSTIVSEHCRLWRAALVGGLWGVGHTASLIVAGVAVLVLRVAIPEHLAKVLEFGVALMILGLGARVLARAFRQRGAVHVHKHQHDGLAHVHLHFRDAGEEVRHPHGDAHAVSRIGIKPLLVGAMHGLAGSAALTLLVLTQIDSALIGLAYLAVFGAGSIIGMLLMSGLVGLPFALSARKFTGMNYGLQVAVGVLSIGFGCWYAYETGVVNGVFSAVL